MLHQAFDRAADILRQQWWLEDAGWESINPAVAYFWVEPRLGAGARHNPAELVENPAWVARAVADGMPELEAAVPTDWLPALGKMKATGRGNTVRATVEQLGCGVYGCVLPTHDPAVVCKLTTDDTEVELVRDVLPRVCPAGITAYYATADLGTANVARAKRPLFGLWREAASDIGKVSEASKEMLGDAHAISDTIYRALHHASDPHGLYLAALAGGDAVAGARELAENFHDLTAAWAALAATELAAVGAALLEFLAAGVLISDVHAGNVGHVTRDGADIVVITDPGHAAVLPAPWR
jgi:hypothetical protein